MPRTLETLGLDLTCALELAETAILLLERQGGAARTVNILQRNLIRLKHQHSQTNG